MGGTLAVPEARGDLGATEVGWSRLARPLEEFKAKCPDGKVALFGWTADGAPGAPKLSGGLLVGWQAGTANGNASENAGYTAYAVCADRAS